MKFTIEQRHLTDEVGHPLAPQAVTFHVAEADSAEHAVRDFITVDQAEIIGSILKFPGFQAVATVRKTTGVYTLQVAPASATMVRP